MSKLLVRATNWLGDAVMSLPAIRAIRQVFPRAHIAIAARPWVADLYARETSVDRIIPYTGSRRAFAARLREERFDGAILLQNAFDAALLAWLARIPEFEVTDHAKVTWAGGQVRGPRTIPVRVV